MRRLLTLLALLAPAGCIVGPQEDLPEVTPQGGRDDDGNFGVGEGGPDDEADGDADADADGEPPVGSEDYPDDGDSLPADAASEDDPSADGMVPDLDGQTVPGVPVIPRPGMPSPKPEEPDLDSAVTVPSMPGFETVDEPSDEPTDA
jgi:hypothetical protein